MHMGKSKDFLSEAMPQVKYSAKSRKTEMSSISGHRLEWIMARSERCDMEWWRRGQWNDSKGRKTRQKELERAILLFTF